MREMMDVIFFAMPSSSLLAVRNPAPVASNARMSSKLISQSHGSAFWFSYSNALMRSAASVAASSRVRLIRVFNERMHVSESVTGDAYMMRYFVLSTSLSMSLLSERSTTSRFSQARSYRLPSM